MSALACHQADPRLKLGVALAALGMALAAPRIGSALVLAACALLALVAGPHRRKTPWQALFTAWGLGAVAAALRALLTPGAALVAMRLGEHTLQLSAAGAAEGGLVLARVVAATLVGAWLTGTTPLPQLVAALAWARVPAPLLEIVLLAHRHRHALGEALETIRCAQQMRLGYVGLRRGVASAGVLIGATACRAIDRAGVTAEAMQLRGDRGLAALALPPRCPAADAFAAGFSAIALVASAALAWRGPW